MYLNDNSEGYRLGNSMQADIWAAHTLSPWLSCSLRTNVNVCGRISGQDPQIAIPMNMAMDPGADTHNSGGTVVSLLVGANVRLPHPLLRKFTFQVEAGAPVYQYVNGTQARQHFAFLAGFKYSIR